MPRPPKRIPGERNPVPDGEAPMRVAEESRFGGYDYGIARAVSVVLDWCDRRKARSGRGD